MSRFLNIMLYCRQRAYFKSVTILVPQSWNLPGTLPSVGETLEAAEFRVAPSNPVYGNNPYTVQVGERYLCTVC